MCQCLLMIGPSGGSVLLYVTTSGILCDLSFGLGIYITIYIY